MKKALLEKGEPTTWEEFVSRLLRRSFDAMLRGGSPAMRVVLHTELTYFLNWHPRAMETWKRAEKGAKKRVP